MSYNPNTINKDVVISALMLAFVDMFCLGFMVRPNRFKVYKIAWSISLYYLTTIARQTRVIAWT